MYLLFDTVVQISHLRAFKSSFPEHFYGLKRVTSGQERLSREQLWASFLLVSIMPYARKKLDSSLDKLQHEDASNQVDRQSPAHYFIRIYPLFCFLIEFSELILQVSYALEKSKYHTIWNQMIGVQLVVNRPSNDLTSRSKERIGWSSWLIAKYVAKTIGSGLSAGAFFIQFLEYYYAREGSVTGNLIRLPKPPPPVTSLYSRVYLFSLSSCC